MFPSFIGILDIQSWWEVPSIAYFCSLFRTAFNLLDFDIEELEEALLTDGTEDSAGSLLTELIVRLLNGCLGNNDISAFNFQMYLRRLFRRKCQETGRDNPFDNDIDFQFLPLRTKVEILYALCDFRLDADDVFDLFKNLEAESLRVEPLGWDDNHSAYWYFYGTRLYREDIIKKPKGKTKKKKSREDDDSPIPTPTPPTRREWFADDDWQDDEDTERVWQVVCFTEEDWSHLTQKFSEASSKEEKELYRSLSQNFLPEIPRLFQERERLQRRRLLELAPRRTSSRVLQKIKQKEEEEKQSAGEDKQERRKDTPELAREIRARRRNLLRRKTPISSSSSESESEEMPQKASNSSAAKGRGKKSKKLNAAPKGEPPTEAPVKTGRKTNNSLASATGQILIPDNDVQVSSTRRKLKTSQIFTRTEEDIQTDMYKVLEQLTAHDDAWPFMDPVEEEYAPNYYAVIRRPMDLHKMESRLDSGYYTDFSMFKTDFKLIVNNCRLYNGQDNEYTNMVDKLQAAFDRLTEKYMNRLSSSDEEIAVEYQLPTPSRKHKLKSSESPGRHKRKKRKSNSDGERHRSVSRTVKEEVEEKKETSPIEKKSKESHKIKSEKGKKKRKGHHRHGKHSKSHKTSHKQNKGKHSKKGRHGKNKEGKKSKQKKKKSKHQEVKTEEVLKRSESQESIESSYRSRSASPLPSIHTPTPSPEPTPEPKLEPEFFYKDKFDKIKERRRHAASTSTAPDAWDSLFDHKNKSTEKQKQNLNLPKKDKNQKLRETIEKLKAKNEKYKDTFNALFKSDRGKKTKTSESSTSKQNSNDDDPDFTDDEDDDDDEDDSQKSKPNRKRTKKHVAKNESTTEALEQAVKDISKWLDDPPKGSVASSPSDSPAQTISTEEHDNSRLDDEFPIADKLPAKKETSRKRPSSREPKQVKRREIQRTIGRLQPGKSKGNLLTNSKNTEKTEEAPPPGPQTKARDTGKVEETITQSPKLSLGSVLPTVEFTLGSDHNFENEEKVNEPAEIPKTSEPESPEKKPEENVEEKNKVHKEEKVCTKKDAEVETEPTLISKPSQEKATPNLSAWFKAFGAPKTPAPSPANKKKGDDGENDEKASEITMVEKVSNRKNGTKDDSPTDPGTPNADGGDSPLPNAGATPRQRRTSTGSSVSERSSFSQDLDSPRHQMSHTSPLLRSPASPRDDFQKISYPIINGTVRAGFYQDTTSMKSSPEKSCSPREAPQSPFSPYSAHVYASNSAMGSATPNYFVDHNKSPLPAYGQNPPPYYDTSKVGTVNASKPRVHDEYTSLGPTAYQQAQYSGPYSPAESPYEQSHLSNYSPATRSPQPAIVESLPPVDNTIIATEAKPSPYPVKKRSYIEPEAILTPRKSVELKEPMSVIQNQNDYHRMSQQTMHSTSVDDIALALSEKSEMAKLSLQEKSIEYAEREKTTFDMQDMKARHETKKDLATENKSHESVIKDNVDMVNMGYMNPDYDRRNNAHERIDTHEYPRDAHMNNQPKGYEVDAIAMNLGMNNQQLQKHMSKSNMNSGNIPPAHSNERLHCEMMTQSLTQAHHPYDTLSSGQSISNFSLNDIELANKKLFGCNTTVSAAPALDYGNWKMTGQIRKQETMPSDYSMAYTTSADKLRASINSSNASAINYNKSVQQQQYNNYNVPRASVHAPHRSTEMQLNMSSELRIPNPRSHLKSDNCVSSTMSDNQIAKNMDNLAKTSKSDKHSQSHPLASPMSYKTPYSSHSSLPLDSLRIPQMLERYTNDERYLSSFASGGSSLYHDKSFEMAQMFNKSLAAEVHATSASASIYSQSSMTMSKDANIYKQSTSVTSTSDVKAKSKRKRTSDTKQMQMSGQSYHSPPTDVLSSVKSSMLPGSAFNFGSSANMPLGSGLYGDNGGFSIEDFRTSTANQLMAANYMAAAVAHQQRSTAAAEASAEKLAKPAHQSSGHASSAFPFIGHGQPRGGYPFDTSSPLYQQYLQRHQEELLRQTGAQIMGLYPAGYPGIRQSYDSINRPSWL